MLGDTQLANNNASNAMGTKGRRKLSTIFHRVTAGRSRPRVPKIHGSNCQSPRAHRWLRAAATSGAMGIPRTTRRRSRSRSVRSLPRTGRGSRSHFLARGRRERARRCRLRRALAGERPVAEQVLRHVRDLKRVRINDRSGPKTSRWNSVLRRPRRQHRCHSRLQDAVTVDDAVRARVETRPVERMQQRSDQARSTRAHRHHRVGVECQHKTHAGRR